MLDQKKTFEDCVWAMESALAPAADGAVDLVAARHHLAEAVAVACNLAEVPKQFSTLFEIASKNNKGRRESAILAVRALSVDGLLPLESDHQLERRTAALVEEGFGDQCRSLRLQEKRQTFEKINALKGLHETILQNLRVLRDIPPTLAHLANATGDIQRAVRKEQCNAYFQPFDWNNFRNRITHICEQIAALQSCKDVSYKAKFDELSSSCSELLTHASKKNFLTLNYLFPFAVGVRNALTALKSGAVDQFTCSLEPRRKPPLIAEKRYQLHQVGKLLTITIPMVNSGPGVAVDVQVELDCGAATSIALESEEAALGDIPPGEFAISFTAMIVEASDSVTMAMQVTWTQLFGDSRSAAFDVKLLAQNPNVQWDQLEQLDPYSLEVADGDRFVGRAGKVQAIGNRLLKAQMSSTYITGQKRIGKTSLAQAVLRYVTQHAKLPAKYHTFYLEWGEYSAADAKSTVRGLGEQLHQFLQLHLPAEVSVVQPAFDGSLAPLNATLRLLEATQPNSRFVIVLDEFDELHPEMYRFGALAEAFFANLRTLAARKNLAFILVGGEKMPFIIGAQGDQLNKFVREPLDYFSRSEEWPDYTELVTAPVHNALNWEQSALNEIFTLTNGHPYYTKLLAAKVFSNSVAQRDTDIIASDIRYALSARISELDTNSFAHFWKDGVNAEREEEEVIELKRLRLLVCFGRISRISSVTRELLKEQLPGAGGLHPSDVGPLVDDFCRRDIMTEVNGQLTMQLPIFERWLRDVGVTKLIASTLADDLESALQKARDAAYVSSGELEALVRHWPLYRGHKVTSERVRAWLDQVADTQDQRLLFTILDNMRFVTPAQIGEQLKLAHERFVSKWIPPRVRENKVEKRRDIVITYLDGPGKSGATYARAYAKENELLMEGVMEPGRAVRRLGSEHERPSAIVLVDDLAGTGKTIAESIVGFLSTLAAVPQAQQVPVFVVLLYATEEAIGHLASQLKRHSGINVRLHVCTILTDKDRAFPAEGVGFWPDEQARDRAKALCVRLSAGLYKDPLGFGGQGLVIAFPDTCPNNNLPVIFASRSGTHPWHPLLERPVS